LRAGPRAARPLRFKREAVPRRTAAERRAALRPALPAVFAAPRRAPAFFPPDFFAPAFFAGDFFIAGFFAPGFFVGAFLAAAFAAAGFFATDFFTVGLTADFLAAPPLDAAVAFALAAGLFALDGRAFVAPPATRGN